MHEVVQRGSLFKIMGSSVDEALKKGSKIVEEAICMTLPKVHRSKGRTLFMFSIPNRIGCLTNKNICFHFIPVFYLTQPSNKQIICLDFDKQNSPLPYGILYTLALPS